MTENDIIKKLEQRLGRIHAHLRLGIESESGHHVFGGGINFFHPENWYSTHSLIRFFLHISGMYRRGVRNARNIQIKHNSIHLPRLPKEFEGFTILHLTDLHADMDWDLTHAIADTFKDLEYDICVLTGDYRAKTYGDFEPALEGMQSITQQLRQPIYGVLGNHDSVRMVPGLENQGVHMLINESALLERGGSSIALAGIDDAHYFRVDNLEKTVQNIPEDMISILLSHTPEIYRKAVHAEFDVMLCGHTHGGQICLPGGIPLTLDSKCPRYMGSGKWRYLDMIGYTSVGAGTSIINVRLNCLPEVTLHHLHSGR